MTIIDKINNDFLTAYKAKEENKVGILRLLKSALKNAEIAKKSPLDDKEAISILKKELKIREESAKEYTSAGRSDLADKEKFELSIIQDYLPQQLSETEIEQIVNETIEKLGAKDKSAMGKVIGAIMAEHGDKANGSIVSRLVSQKLSN